MRKLRPLKVGTGSEFLNGRVHQSTAPALCFDQSCAIRHWRGPVAFAAMPRSERVEMSGSGKTAEDGSGPVGGGGGGGVGGESQLQPLLESDARSVGGSSAHTGLPSVVEHWEVRLQRHCRGRHAAPDFAGCCSSLGGASTGSWRPARPCFATLQSACTSRTQSWGSGWPLPFAAMILPPRACIRQAL